MKIITIHLPDPEAPRSISDPSIDRVEIEIVSRSRFEEGVEYIKSRGPVVESDGVVVGRSNTLPGSDYLLVFVP